MSVHWSSEIAKWEYRELQASAMSVDYTGNNVLLAGRRWLAIKQINLEEDAGDIVKKYPRQSKYDAAGAEWCQTYQGQKLCAIASNQRVDVYEWRSGNDLTCISSLRGHTRVVSDTHFHRQDHNLIATCSIDTFTHLWDLRDARKPVVSLCAVAGASQVQWNKVASHLVATAHDGDIKIWDYRKNSAPIHYISAHLCKIHGVDWSPHHEYQLVTSSHDGSIKYFDISNSRRPENIIMTNFPVWRAIYTPFGSGLLTIGVGWGGLPRAEQSGVIGIWVGGTLTHRLVGHTDTVQTMVWRPNTAPSNYQLITWGRDQSLRVWSMHPTLLKMCNHYLPDDTEGDDNNSDTGSCTSTVGSMNDLSSDNKGHDIQMNKLSNKSTTIDEEFESIREMANIEVTDMNTETRTCQIHSERNGYTANLQVTFPKNVSEQTIPKFSWLSGTNVDGPTTVKILQAINRTAYRKKKEGHRCLLHCLKTLATSIDEIPVKSSDDSDSMKSSQRSQSESENAGDSCIPFPRTCGAKWCCVSTLVVFNRPTNARRLSLKHEAGTPRSMSSLSLTPALFGTGYTSVSPLATTTPSPTNASGFPQLHHRHPSNSITTFYFQDRWTPGRRTGSMRSRGSISGIAAPRVVLYAATNLFPLNRTLAERYVVNAENPVCMYFDSNVYILDMCENNARIAAEEGESELAHAWGLAGLAAQSLKARVVDHLASSEESMGWVGHPLCCNLLQSLISHYAKASNLQMAAMLACAFSVFNESSNSSSLSTISTSSYGNGTSPYSTVNQFSEISADGWTLPTLRSNSCSEAENFYTDSTVSREKFDRGAACIVDEQVVHAYHCFKRVYADILHHWQLLYKKTEVMKLVGCKHDATHGTHLGPEVAAECAWCGRLARSPVCSSCRRLALRCAVCALGVRGLACACVYCGHAGHAHHMLKWFSEHDTCPTGCGCKCLLEGSPAWKGVKYA
ncbi:GATOR complex protein WDR59 isoform X2 [Hyposmocoma kahamanoa]|uniref:GATOR complex protein WDR59 isoform X2 n=1 Tax=Hyposmocoma kahamanoa TaxID=1477025 RepID=UPI000E6D730C|nr:GATOR complex protein WDR59 isoform X2 [Hyposmocoma kahamanoa]